MPNLPNIVHSNVNPQMVDVHPNPRSSEPKLHHTFQKTHGKPDQHLTNDAFLWYLRIAFDQWSRSKSTSGMIWDDHFRCKGGPFGDASDGIALSLS